MRSDTPKYEKKGLHRSLPSLKLIFRSLEQVQTGSNNPIHVATLQLFLSVFVKRLYNITYSDLQINAPTVVKETSTANYCIVFFGLLMHYKCTRNQLIKQFGLNYRTTTKIIDQLIQLGYIRTYTERLLRHEASGRRFLKEQSFIELTSKGYDKANEVFKILIDWRFLT